MRLLSFALVWPALLAVGCYGEHGRGRVDAGPGDAGIRTSCNCCGRLVPVTRGESCELVCWPLCVPDAGTPPPPGCEESATPRLLDQLCADAVYAGTPTTIPVAFGGEGECYCGEQVGCRAERGAEPFVLELTTELCAGELLCDGCFPFVDGGCTLPALEEGLWEVRNNGERLFTLGVSPRGGPRPEWGLSCESRGASNIHACDHTWPPRPVPAETRICHPTAASAGERVTLRVTEGCASCGTFAGPCDVEVFDDIIRVTPTLLEATCTVDCPGGGCQPQPHTCVTPPLPAGLWRVDVVGSGIRSSLEVVDAGQPVTPGELCTFGG